MSKAGLLADREYMRNVWEDVASELRMELFLSLLPPIPVYVLASTYQIAKSIFDRYFIHTGLSRRIDLRYIDSVERLFGVRGIYIVTSNERYPSNSFYDRLWWVESQAEYRHFEVVHEQDLEKEQVRGMVSRKRQI